MINKILVVSPGMLFLIDLRLFDPPLTPSRVDAKQPSRISLVLHLLVLKCNCQTFDDNSIPKLKKKRALLFWGCIICSKIRPKVCPEIGKLIDVM